MNPGNKVNLDAELTPGVSSSFEPPTSRTGLCSSDAEDQTQVGREKEAPPVQLTPAEWKIPGDSQVVWTSQYANPFQEFPHAPTLESGSETNAIHVTADEEQMQSLEKEKICLENATENSTDSSQSKADEAKARASSQDTAEKKSKKRGGRGSYRCTLCGAKKEYHICQAIRIAEAGTQTVEAVSLTSELSKGSKLIAVGEFHPAVNKTRDDGGGTLTRCHSNSPDESPAEKPNTSVSRPNRLEVPVKRRNISGLSRPDQQTEILSDQRNSALPSRSGIDTTATLFMDTYSDEEIESVAV